MPTTTMSPTLLPATSTPTVPVRLPSLRVASSRSFPSPALFDHPPKHNASRAPTATTAKTTLRRGQAKAVTLPRRKALLPLNSPTALATSLAACKTPSQAGKAPLSPRPKHSASNSLNNSLNRSLQACKSSSRSCAVARYPALIAEHSCEPVYAPHRHHSPPPASLLHLSPLLLSLPLLRLLRSATGKPKEEKGTPQGPFALLCPIASLGRENCNPITLYLFFTVIHSIHNTYTGPENLLSNKNGDVFGSTLSLLFSILCSIKAKTCILPHSSFFA